MEPIKRRKDRKKKEGEGGRGKNISEEEVRRPSRMV